MISTKIPAIGETPTKLNNHLGFILWRMTAAVLSLRGYCQIIQEGFQETLTFPYYI
jgi:hypothetical protein